MNSSDLTRELLAALADREPGLLSYPGPNIDDVCLGVFPLEMAQEKVRLLRGVGVSTAEVGGPVQEEGKVLRPVFAEMMEAAVAHAKGHLATICS